MKEINRILIDLKENWEKPHKAIHSKGECPFLLKCTIDCKPDIQSIENTLILDVPEHVKDFWRFTKEAYLFQDIEYGQWGLHIYSVGNSIEITKEILTDRPEEILVTDLVLGNFLGDSDLLIVNCNKNSQDYGEVIIGLPLDRRNDWYFLQINFQQFLSEYSIRNGEKFWIV